MTDAHPLRVWRKKSKKTLTWLAARVGCEPSFLSDVERGVKFPGLTLALKLSDLSGIPVEQFARQRENA